ncbi:hypothetical protein HF086_010898 [Spodoptera exigua]|uniref:Uncharacterized protein n=1 Tax=Spodoptera exigua TaxID=7107 RepID=A0A922SGH2_SPOEX|nr:hypothetical protein HF086_010898 [Spodoptera exigua]
MGVKVIALIALLVVSVYGQDVTVSDNEVTKEVVVDNLFSEDTTVLETVTEPTKDEVVEEANPVEIISATDDLQVRSGKYQLNDGLVGEEPISLDAVNFDSNNDAGESEKQLLSPGTTQVTNNEYGIKGVTKFLDNHDLAKSTDTKSMVPTYVGVFAQTLAHIVFVYDTEGTNDKHLAMFDNV